MKIAINTENYDVINAFIKNAKDHGNSIAVSKAESVLFNHIELGDIDAFILSNSNYIQKAVDFIKKSNPYTPVVIISKGKEQTTINSSDFVILFNDELDLDHFTKTTLQNIYTYSKNFETLQKLTTKMADIVEFGQCKYDPTRRLLYYKGKEVKKLSTKEGGVLEILAQHFGNVVKKEIILQKVWHKTDYFVGRSLDVYTTHLRNTLKDAKIKMSIKNISNIGLILE